MTDKEKLREALAENTNEAGLPSSYTPYSAAVTITQAAAEYLKILEGDMVVVPRELTAENGMKRALSHEFFEWFEYCDEGEEICSKVYVSWPTIKEIHRAVVNQTMIAAGGEDE